MEHAARWARRVVVIVTGLGLLALAAGCGGGAEAGEPWSTGNLILLEGATLKGDDGTFLGKITRYGIGTDSISYRYGEYGSPYSATSIFNRYGEYGSDFSDKSAFSPYAFHPPGIYQDDSFVAYLTKSTFLSPRVDPDDLLKWLELERSATTTPPPPATLPPSPPATPQSPG